MAAAFVPTVGATPLHRGRTAASSGLTCQPRAVAAAASALLGRRFAAAAAAPTPPRVTAAPARPTMQVSSPSGAKLADMLDSYPRELRSALLLLPEDADITPVGQRHTKIMATIGPSACDAPALLRLAAGGMDLARLNLSHGDFAFHEKVVATIRDINVNSPFVVATMFDLGSLDSVRLGEFSRAPALAKDDIFTLTVRHMPEYSPSMSEVSYDGFIHVAEVGDTVSAQSETGAYVEMTVTDLTSTDVVCRVTVPGALRSRGSISIRGKSLSSSGRGGPASRSAGEEGVDGADVDFNASIAYSVLGCPPDELEFAIRQRVEYIALSFVESAETVLAVRRLLARRGANIGVVAKIESADGLRNLESIVAAADAIMVARGDLGTAIPFELVPSWQARIADVCRRHGKACMVSTHFLESMVLYPTPTRAEVTDMTEVVKQRADVLVLTAETASGRFPFKALATMHAVLKRTEGAVRERLVETRRGVLAGAADTPALITDDEWWESGVGGVAESIAASAAELANARAASAILVFTQKGLMASLVSRYRPDTPVFAFTPTPTVRNKLTMLYGVRPFRLEFQEDSEATISAALDVLKERHAVAVGDEIIVVADVLGGSHGASDADCRRVFAEVARGRGASSLSATDVVLALRKLRLKVSDKLEAELRMRTIDVADATSEMSVLRARGPSESSSSKSSERYDYDRFKAIVADAVEVVHTVQMRPV